jgi:hypothetical protein
MRTLKNYSKYAISSVVLAVLPWILCILLESFLDSIKHTIGYDNTMYLSYISLLCFLVSFVLSVAFAIVAIIKEKKRGVKGAKLAWISLFINFLLVILLLVSSLFFE